MNDAVDDIERHAGKLTRLFNTRGSLNGNVSTRHVNLREREEWFSQTNNVEISQQYSEADSSI